MHRGRRAADLSTLRGRADPAAAEEFVDGAAGKARNAHPYVEIAARLLLSFAGGLALPLRPAFHLRVRPVDGAEGLFRHVLNSSWRKFLPYAPDHSFLFAWPSIFLSRNGIGSGGCRFYLVGAVLSRPACLASGR